MAGETTLETGARVITVLRGSPSAMRHLYSNLVTHEKAVIVFCDTFLSSSGRLKLLTVSHRQTDLSRNTKRNTHDEAISNFQLNVNDISDFAEAASEVVLSRILGKTSDVHFVWLRNRIVLPVRTLRFWPKSSSTHLDLLFASSIIALTSFRRRRGDRVAVVCERH